MSTLKKIAELCGVSPTTVSNILNNKGRAGAETKAKVLALVKEMQYSPNTFARTLKVPESAHTIGIITEDLTVFNTPEIVNGIEEVCEKNGYDVLINNLRFFKRFKKSFYNTDEHHAHIANELRHMLGQKVEGVIYVGCHARSLSISPENFPIPIAVAYSFCSDTSVPSIIFDDVQAAYDATSALITSNHHSIGIICGNSNSIHTSQRLLGYQNALYDHGILYNPQLVVPGDWEAKYGYRGCQKLISLNVDGIFAMNDLLAGGVIACAKDNGIEIGKELSLVGFDNREICTAYSPTLSTMSLPLSEIGQKAAEVVLDHIHHRLSAECLEYPIKIPCKYIKRESIGTA